MRRVYYQTQTVLHSISHFNSIIINYSPHNSLHASCIKYYTCTSVYMCIYVYVCVCLSFVDVMDQ